MLPWDSSSSYLTVLPQASPCSSKASWGAPGRVKLETHSSRTTAYHHQRTSVGPGEVFGLEPKEVSPFVLLYIFALLYSINFESLTHFVSPEFPPAASSHFRAFVKTPASHFFRRSTKAASMNLQDDWMQLPRLLTETDQPSRIGTMEDGKKLFSKVLWMQKH